MKIGIAGVGGMGRHHGRVVKEFKFVREILGCDLSPDARKLAEKEGMRTVGDLPTLLAWKPDAVIVATQPSAHAPLIEACFQAGVPVLTEKPLATTIADCRRLVAMGKKLRIPFQVGFELRYCGLHRAMVDVVKSGKIGKPVSMGLVQISGAHQKGYFTKKRCVGIFWEKLCHQVDIYRYWFGEPERIMAFAGQNVIKHYGISDNVQAVIAFPGGHSGTITMTSARAAQVGGTDDHGDRGHFYELTLTCTKGSVTYEAWTEMISVVKFNHRPDCLTELVERFAVEPRYPHAGYNLTDQDTDFFLRVRDGKKLQFPAEDALKTMEWVAKAEKSISQGGKWIT